MHLQLFESQGCLILSGTSASVSTLHAGSVTTSYRKASHDFHKLCHSSFYAAPVPLLSNHGHSIIIRSVPASTVPVAYAFYLASHRGNDPGILHDRRGRFVVLSRMTDRRGLTGE